MWRASPQVTNICSNTSEPLVCQDLMSAIVNAVFPLFALILLGYLSARKRLLGPGSVDSLNKFVVWMALPALLFQAMAKITWQDINQPGYVAASGLAIAAVFGVSYFMDRKRHGR